MMPYSSTGTRDTKVWESAKWGRKDRAVGRYSCDRNKLPYGEVCICTTPPVALSHSNSMLFWVGDFDLGGATVGRANTK